ncbi:DNA polymerase Y family protein [Novosphingobium sp. PhB55]|uniref:Y-family DNA polymerase n=1 Tax=Novosphingobium sp. PhB55 TaxID=2485106 RepID=UPI001AB05E8F
MATRRYLAVTFPFLPSERAMREGAAPPDAAFALIAKQRGAQRIMALSPAALALGLSAGMMLADARALEPDLPALEHRPAADHALLLRIVESCERYTPMVAPDRDDALVLDLTGCFDSLGMDEDAVRGDLVTRLARRGFRALAACAGTPDAALALARFGKSTLRELPVAALSLGDDAHLALKRAGLRTLGQLADRPRAPLAARFGKAMSIALAHLLEEQDRRITPHRTLPPIWVEQRFAEPMATVKPLLGVIEWLAGQARDVLVARGRGGRRYEVSLFRTDGHVARLAVDSGLPLREPADVVRLFRERIESLADPLDPGFGYDLLRLAVPLHEDVSEGQDRLDEENSGKPDLAPLLDRLQVRFGAECVHRFAPRDEHLPEYADRLVPPASIPQPWPQPEAGEPPLRPLFLFDPPQPVTVLAEVPDGPPRRFGWQGRQHRVVRQEGPERLAYPWWKTVEATGPTRDYYRIEDSDGRRFWLFRHGLYGSEKADPRWYLHGVFA